MSSRGHFLLIMIVIYQNVCLDVWVSKMVPAMFSINCQGQRSKVSALRYNGPMIMSLFMVSIMQICGLNRVISKGNTLHYSKMKLTNDLGNPFGKVKVI